MQKYIIISQEKDYKSLPTVESHSERTLPKRPIY